MATQYIFDPNLTRSKLKNALQVKTLELAVAVRGFFNTNGDPATNSLTTWGHRSALFPNMGMSVSVSDEGATGATDKTQMLITLYRDDGVFYEAYSNGQGEGTALPSAPAMTREMFLILVGEMLSVYGDIGAFPSNMVALPKTA